MSDQAVIDRHHSYGINMDRRDRFEGQVVRARDAIAKAGAPSFDKTPSRELDRDDIRGKSAMPSIIDATSSPKHSLQIDNSDLHHIPVLKIDSAEASPPPVATCLGRAMSPARRGTSTEE